MIEALSAIERGEGVGMEGHRVRNQARVAAGDIRTDQVMFVSHNEEFELYPGS